MSTPINDGGPMHPCTCMEDNGRGYGDKRAVHYSGMSLRQHFAGLAMAALLGREDEHIYGHGKIAELAYALADAMIAEGAAK
jgi:hypothetical protein